MVMNPKSKVEETDRRTMDILERIPASWALDTGQLGTGQLGAEHILKYIVIYCNLCNPNVWGQIVRGPICLEPEGEGHPVEPHFLHR